MTLAIRSARQHPSAAYLDFVFGDFVSGVAANAIELPDGAIVIGGDVVVDTVWNSVTSDVISVGDSGSATRYMSAVTIAAAARTALTITGYKYTTPTYIQLKWTGVGTAPTTGAGRLRVDYIVRGRSMFTQGKDYFSGGRLA